MKLSEEQYNEIITYIPSHQQNEMRQINKRMNTIVDEHKDKKADPSYKYLHLYEDRGVTVPNEVTTLKIDTEKDDYTELFFSLFMFLPDSNIKKMILTIHNTEKTILLVQKMLIHFPETADLVLKIYNLDESVIDKFILDKRVQYICGMNSMINESATKEKVIIMQQNYSIFEHKIPFFVFEASSFDVYKAKIMA